MLKTICNNDKVPRTLIFDSQTLLQNTTDDGSFQDFKFNYVEMAKIKNYNTAFIWTNKVTGCIKSSFKDDLRKDIIRAAYKVLISWTVMEETPK